jgi:hypothetical protein
MRESHTTRLRHEVARIRLEGEDLAGKGTAMGAGVTATARGNGGAIRRAVAGRERWSGPTYGC